MNIQENYRNTLALSPVSSLPISVILMRFGLFIQAGMLKDQPEWGPTGSGKINNDIGSITIYATQFHPVIEGKPLHIVPTSFFWIRGISVEL